MLENEAKRKSIENEEVEDDVASDEKNSSADSGIEDDVFYDSDGNEQDEEWVLIN